MDFTHSGTTSPKQKNSSKVWFITAGIILLILILFWEFKPFYLLKNLGPQEMGLKIRSGKIVDVVGPGGIYSDFGLQLGLDKYNLSGLQYDVSDTEVFTSELQPLEVTVQGTVFRPSLTTIKSKNADGTPVYYTKDDIAKLYVNYKKIYTNDSQLLNQMEGFAKQAMKVCVGQNDLRGNAVAKGRDTLRNCIEDEISNLISGIGLTTNNVVVANIKASNEAMQVINDTNQYLLDAEKAKANAQKLEEEGKANAVQKEAEVRVQQAEAQEKARQQVTLAQLEKQQLVAEQDVLKTQIENTKIEQDLNSQKAIAAEKQAETDLANTKMLAAIYEANPNYYQYMIAQLNASAIKNTDKFLIVPEGTVPQIVLGKDVIPTVDTGKTDLTGSN